MGWGEAGARLRRGRVPNKNHLSLYTTRQEYVKRIALGAWLACTQHGVTCVYTRRSTCPAELVSIVRHADCAMFLANLPGNPDEPMPDRVWRNNRLHADDQKLVLSVISATTRKFYDKYDTRRRRRDLPPQGKEKKINA